ncbi:hypothetical protein D516_3921 [Rhodobacter sp. AKP1]|nr:hypothetical protein D516_3921 [Rhodobacter sp. AKP1]
MRRFVNPVFRECAKWGKNEHAPPRVALLAGRGAARVLARPGPAERLFTRDRPRVRGDAFFSKRCPTGASPVGEGCQWASCALARASELCASQGGRGRGGEAPVPSRRGP